MKLILFLYEKNESRYSEILAHLGSRSTQTLAMKELEQEGLIKRRVVVDVRPTQAYYSLTEKGRRVAKSLSESRKSLAE